MRDVSAALTKITQVDAALWSEGKAFGGIDEAGRGPLCGPVVAACAVMPPQPLIQGINDSKKLSEARREALYEEIVRTAVFWQVGMADVTEIERLNILEATKLAMTRAAQGAPCGLFLVDGNQPVELPGQVRLLVGGDASCYSIAAASILAKVTRDRLVRTYDDIYPGYGFAKHKGYGTAEHVAAIRSLGPTPVHRLFFLRNILSKEA